MPQATLADLPALPTVDVPRVELCRVGVWNGRPYTAQELAAVAATWQELRGQWDVPLTLGHDGESSLGDGAPACGWVDNVTFEGDTLYGDYRKVPARLAQLLPTSYPKRSCTFLENATIAGAKRGLVLRNVALLGAQQPAVDGLADVAALYNARQLAAEGGTLVTLAAGVFKTEGGQHFHVSDYAYTPDDADPSTWKLRITKTPGGAPDAGLVGAAVAAFGKGFRGQKASIPAADRAAVKSRLRGAWAKANPDKSEADMPDAIQNARALALTLARLPEDARQALAVWQSTHPAALQLVSGPTVNDEQTAVMKALQAAGYPPAMGDDDTDADTPGADGPSCNAVDWYMSGDPHSVIVTDQDADNLFEIPYTYDQAQDAATLQAPIPVKGTYTQNTSGEESGTPPPAAADADADGDAAPPPAADGTDAGAAAGAPDGAAAQRMARLAAQAPADTAVEQLIAEAESEFDKLLTAVNGIASGKPGVAEFRAMLDAAKKSMGRIKIAKPTDGAASDAPSPKPIPVQNSRQEEPDVKLSALAKIYGLPETATEDEVLRAAEASTVAAPLVTKLARQMDEFVRERAEAKVDAMLQTAISEGRLKRWAKPGEDGELYTQLRTLARANADQAEAIIRTLPKLVDTQEYGAAGDAGTPPANQFSPGVVRELRKLGRDPETINPRSLGDQWRDQLRERQKAHAAKLGNPSPVRG